MLWALTERFPVEGGDVFGAGLVDAEEVHGGGRGGAAALFLSLEGPQAVAQHRGKLPCLTGSERVS